MGQKKKTVSEELNLLIKRQTKGEEKTSENELTLVEKLEEELKKRKKETQKKIKEEEDKKIIEFGRSLIKKHELENAEQLQELTIGNQEKNTSENFSKEQKEVLQQLIEFGKEVTEQPNKFIDINKIKSDLSHLYEVFPEEFFANGGQG